MQDVRYLGKIKKCTTQTSVGFCGFIQLFKELLHMGEMFVNGPFEEMQESSVIDGLRIHKLRRGMSTINGSKLD